MISGPSEVSVVVLGSAGGQAPAFPETRVAEEP